jgi:hypothetical protein
MNVSNRLRVACVAALVTCVGIAGDSARGQAPTPPPSGRRELVGVVKDPRGIGVEGAIVEILGATTRTDVRGTFRLFTPNLDTATIAIRRPGYSPIEAQISARNRQWDTVMVEMEPNSQLLAGVRIEEDRDRQRQGMRGFNERFKAKLGGLFITRDDIAQRNSLLLSDVLQTRRGVQLVRLGSRRYGVRFPTYAGRGLNCTPDMWLDGQRALGMEIDDIPANTVEAMELYDSFASVPSEFAHSANSVPCGTIIVWTRPPGTKKP